MGSSFGLVMVVMCSDVVHIVGKITKFFSYAPRNVKDFLSAVNCAINFRSSCCSIYKCGKAKIHISYKIISSLELFPPTHLYCQYFFRQQYSSWHRLQSLRNSHALSAPTSVSLSIKIKCFLHIFLHCFG